MHPGNAKSHEDAAENEAQRRCTLATNDVKADAGYQDRYHERKNGQSDVVGHRYRHDEREHGDEVHRPYSAPHRKRGSYQPRATRESPGGPQVPTEIEGGVRREAGNQNGQSDEIRIVCSGNEHRVRPTSDQTLTDDGVSVFHDTPWPLIGPKRAPGRLHPARIESRSRGADP